MSIDSSKSKDYKPLSSSSKNGGMVSNDLPPLRSYNGAANVPAEPESLVNLSQRAEPSAGSDATRSVADVVFNTATVPDVPRPSRNGKATPKQEKKAKKEEKDRTLLSQDRWLARNGHLLTYVGLYIFSILVLFRPYELISSLEFLAATAFYLPLATLAIFVPSQLATEGNLTMLSTEVKAIVAMTVIAAISIPIARNPALAWSTFNDLYVKSVIIFVVLVNVVRTRKRLMGMMWLSFGIGIYLSFTALFLYMSGKFSVESYRVGVDVGGMFGNPNEMAMHFVMMTPLVIVLGIAAKSSAKRWLYFAMAALFIGANMVTFSRGGFLGLIACGAVLAWKIGRKYRLNVTIASIVVGALFFIAAPGNYGLRMLSIFVPGLDAVGSSDQRKELLWRSIFVTFRNPWGVGIGNFPIVGIRDLQTHNAYTQVSSELGVLGLVAYMIFMISPFRKLSAIERTLFDKDQHDWFYYLSIGLQASIVGYWVSSFFASVAYNWFIYYLIAYAVAFRRIYNIERETADEAKAEPVWESQPVAAI